MLREVLQFALKDIQLDLESQDLQLDMLKVECPEWQMLKNAFIDRTRRPC